MFLSEQPSPADDPGHGTIMMNQIGYMPKQCLYRKPDTRLDVGIKVGELRPEPCLAATLFGHRLLSGAAEAVPLVPRDDSHFCSGDLERSLV
jgi:hypothetical protein